MHLTTRPICAAGLTAALVLAAAAPAALSLPMPARAATAQQAAAPAEAPDPATETDGVLVTLAGDAAARLQSADDASARADEAASALAARGVEVTGVAGAAGGTVTLSATAGDGLTDEEAAEAARSVPGVASAQPNYVYALEPTSSLAEAAGASLLSDTDLPRVQTLLPANDPITANGSPSSGENQYWARSAGLVGAWRQARSAGTVTVAVLDSGALLGHEDLRDNVLSDLAWDAYADAPLTGPVGKGELTRSHGTQVAGVIAATANNGVGLAGASYNARVLPISVINDNDGVSSRELIAAYSYLFRLVDEGGLTDLHVVNMSLGRRSNDEPEDLALEGYIARARDEYRIATVCSGGNAAGITNYPSDFEESVAVSALDASGNAVLSYNNNAAKDISAPGQAIWSTSHAGASSYAPGSGSSMAAPVVSGAVALMFAAKPDATVDEVLQALYSTATVVENQPASSGSAGAMDARAAVSAIVDGTEAPAFTDVPDDSWFADPVAFVARRGVMNGVGGGLFAAGQPVRREDVAGALYNYLGNGEVSPSSGMEDVVPGAYYERAVDWAVAHGVMNGYGDGTFGVGDSLTRQQAAAVFANLLALGSDVASADESALAAFADAPEVDDWGGGGRKTVAWAVANGVMNGWTDDSGARRLAPQASTSRAELAALLQNAMGRGLL